MTGMTTGQAEKRPRWIPNTYLLDTGVFVLSILVLSGPAVFVIRVVMGQVGSDVLGIGQTCILYLPYKIHGTWQNLYKVEARPVLEAAGNCD